MSGVLLWVGVGLLGGLGACCRFILDSTISRRTSGAFPLGTLAVNASGALALGLLSGMALPADALLLSGTALLGGYTTFSTWMLETQRLAEEGALRSASFNLALSLILGLSGAALGHWLGGLL